MAIATIIEAALVSDAAEEKKKKRKTRPLYERHAEKVFRGADNECWFWIGAVGSDGYGGIVDWDGKPLRAHRVAYEHAKGAIPSGMLIMHMCDNPLCQNPRHLVAGTHKQNSQDMAKKRRNVGVRRLSDDAVFAILRSAKAGSCAKALAAAHGVTARAIKKVLTGESYGWLTGIAINGAVAQQ